MIAVSTPVAPMPGKEPVDDALFARNRELDDLDILDEVDVDRNLLSLQRG
jgi:hypothetical protein